MKRFFFLTVLLIHCFVLKAFSQHFSTSEARADKMILLAIDITKLDDAYDVYLSNVRIINTSKKTGFNKSAKWEEGDFLCIVLDSKSNIVDTVIIPRPLQPRYSSYGTDGSMTTHTVYQKNNNVLLRFPYKPYYKYLKIKKVEAHKTLKEVGILEITKN